MTEIVPDTKQRTPDLLGIGDCARAINRDVSTTRAYVTDLWRQGVPGVLRVSNGAFVLRPRALSALRNAVRGKK